MRQPARVPAAVTPVGMRERPIFVVGCPRSGTTVLRDLLRSHSRLFFPRESCGLPGLYRIHGDPRSDREAGPLAADFLDSHAVGDWNLGPQPAELEHGRSFAEVIRPACEAWARSQGKSRWGDKTPQHVLAIRPEGADVADADSLARRAVARDVLEQARAYRAAEIAELGPPVLGGLAGKGGLVRPPLAAR